MIKKALIAAAALLALSAHAGYAQLAPPAGFSTSSGGFAYAAAANDRVYGKVIHQAGALAANVGGQAVKMPAAYRLAANAPRIAAAVIYLNPYVRTGAAIAAWLGVAGLVWDAANNKWVTNQVSNYPVSDGEMYFVGSNYTLYPSKEAACSAFYGGGGGSGYVISSTSVEGNTCYANAYYFDPPGTVLKRFSAPIIVSGEASSCPAGWYVTPAGCVQTPPPVEVTQQQFEEALAPKPMPEKVPLELPGNTPLPVEQPYINPDPGENPSNKPLRIPTGNPVPVPNTDPQQWRQPYVDIVPAPTPESPWRVDVKPGETTSTNPNPAENPQPDSQDKPAEEEDKSLCEKHPEVAACEKVEVTDKPLPDQPKLYEPKYPDGITGVWNSKIQEIKATPLFNLAPSLLPNVSAGTCPSWKVDLSIDGWTNAGLQDLSPPCWVWDVAKLVIIASALLLARRLIFGG